MKKIVYTLGLLLVAFAVEAQTVSIPDAKFENQLLQQGIDTDGQVNGVISLSDALAVTSLTIMPENPQSNCNEPDYRDCYIRDFTGLGAFANIQELRIQLVFLDELDLSGLVNLKKLELYRTNLSSIDLSHNTLLEEVRIPMGDDTPPMNNIQELNLSNNPHIKTIYTPGMNKLDLRNGNNNPEMTIHVGCLWCQTVGQIHYNVCIAVDNPEVANQGQFPYSEWEINHLEVSYSYGSNTENCSLSVDNHANNKFVIFPNPTSDYITITSDTNMSVNKVEIYDYLGRLVMQPNVNDNRLLVYGLLRGSYLVRLSTLEGIETHKIVVN
ncbi:MAG: T9SS type A sorting domain-containing protein [Bacteroidota bacterium]|nr:T9SS type A sorting domain-containing protein [Bacteroidota bacterium]